MLCSFRSPGTAICSAYLRPQRLRVVGLALLPFSGIGLQLLNPQIIRYFIDNAQAAGRCATSCWLRAPTCSSGCSHGCSTLPPPTAGSTWPGLPHALRADLVSHLLRLDMPFHKTHTPGEPIEAWTAT